MQDMFDQYVSNHREAFDDNEPPVDMWERIAAKAGIEAQPKGGKMRWLTGAQYAAAAVVVSLAVTLAWSLLRQPQGKPTAASPFEAQVNEAALYYESEIAQRQQAVFELTSDQPNIRNGIEQDMAALDTVLVQLKRDLKDDVSNAEVLEAMIQNYRLKLEILEEVLGYVKAKTPETDKTVTHEL